MANYTEGDVVISRKFAKNFDAPAELRHFLIKIRRSSLSIFFEVIEKPKIADLETNNNSNFFSFHLNC